MSGDNFSNGFGKNRPVLGDLTNRPSKGGSSISGNLGLKSGEECDKNADCKDGYSRFAKKVCLGVENLVREKCATARSGVDVKGLSLLKGKQACGLSPNPSDVNSLVEKIVPDISNNNIAIKEASNLLEENHNLEKGDMVSSHSVIEVGDASRDSCLSSVSMPISLEPHGKDGLKIGQKCQDDEGRVTFCDVNQSNAMCTTMHKGLVTRICKPDGEDIAVGRLALNKYGAVDWSRLPRYQGSKSFELEKCSGLKGDGCANLNEGEELLKACTCSFCLKAAYIWSDLHYQDIKGRIAALKKSQKEAGILAQKSSREKDVGIHGQGNSSKSSKLESDLTGHWRSLFLNMEDILVRESSQIQASFAALKDLRENCKMNLERINAMPSDKN